MKKCTQCGGKMEGYDACSGSSVCSPCYRSNVREEQERKLTMSYIFPETKRLGVRVTDCTPSFDATKKHPMQRGVYAVMLAGSMWNGWRAWDGTWSPRTFPTIEEAWNDVWNKANGVQSFDGVWSGLNERGYERIENEQRMLARDRAHFGTARSVNLTREFNERADTDFTLSKIWPSVSKAGKITTHLNKAAWHIKQATEIANEPPTS